MSPGRRRATHTVSPRLASSKPKPPIRQRLRNLTGGRWRRASIRIAHICAVISGLNRRNPGRFRSLRRIRRPCFVSLVLESVTGPCARMRTRVKLFFPAPVFPDSEEKTRQAEILRVLLLCQVATSIVGGSIGLFFVFFEKIISSIAIGIGLAVALVSLAILHRGHVRTAAIVNSVTSWLIVTTVVFLSGGLASADAFLYLGVMFAAGLTIGMPAATIAMVASSAVLLVGALAENAGYAIPRVLPHPPETRWLLFTFSAIWALVPLKIAMTRLKAALNQAEEEIDRRRAVEAEMHNLNLRLESRVQERTAELENANEELQAFSYSVSHDLRAPLRASAGFCRILLDMYAARLDEDGQRFLARVEDNTQRMSRLIDDLLAFSRLGRKPVERQEVDVDEVVRDVVSELQPEIRSHGVVLEVSPLPDCFGDPGLLRQVFANLLGNAVKYSAPRDMAHVEVGYSLIDGEVVYSVRDNGVGFDMEHAENLFGVFQRLHREDEFEGTGIGLAIVQRILSQHGGRIWAEAEVDKGAAFHFVINPKEESPRLRVAVSR